jgi:hypothetical protein
VSRDLPVPTIAGVWPLTRRRTWFRDAARGICLEYFYFTESNNVAARRREPAEAAMVTVDVVDRLRCAAMRTEAVEIVTVAEYVAAVASRLGGLKVHDAPAGSPEQLNEIAPATPPCYQDCAIGALSGSDCKHRPPESDGDYLILPHSGSNWRCQSNWP